MREHSGGPGWELFAGRFLLLVGIWVIRDWRQNVERFHERGRRGLVRRFLHGTSDAPRALGFVVLGGVFGATGFAMAVDGFLSLQ